MKLVNLNIK